MSFGQHERPWFVTALCKITHKSGYQQWAQVEQCLRLFYFSDRVFGASFRAIWAEVESLTLLLDDWQEEENVVATEHA
jgi:hypothetical protein